MTNQAWTTAEATLRRYFAERGVELLDVTAKPESTLGLAFWVRYVAGGGGLVLVRDAEVLAEPSPASVDRFVELDDVLHRKTVSAADFLYVVTVWKALPDLGSNPIREHVKAALNPAWVRTADTTAFVVHAARTTSAGSRNRPMMAVRRATAQIGAHGITWIIEDTEASLA
ncbi:MAG: hypothetical protein NT062_05900 [Proteobacteria bacterium]|nr:hypothetical protein [Pseudomonadota bacterium]